MADVPDTDPLMAIGMFSRACSVSVKALRAYHEMGLLIPAAVDPATSHRSYRVSQLTDATVIKRLRDLVIRGQMQHGDYATFLDAAFADLYATLASSGAVPAGPSAARYPATVDTDDEPVEALLPITGPVTVDHERGVLAIIPEATCAVATHAGGYHTIADTYRQLGAWVAHHAVSADQPVRELYVVSVDPVTFQLVPPDERRTEICWPIVASRSNPPHNQGTTP